MPRPYRAQDWIGLVLVLAAAAGARLWYLGAHDDWGQGNAHHQYGVQDGALAPRADWHWLCRLSDGELSGDYAAPAPLSPGFETTAHVAPGYPYFCRVVDFANRRGGGSAEQFYVILKWSQFALGTLACTCVFFLARRAFPSAAVAFLAGLLAAANPFWVLNVPEFDDGVLASFLVSWSLALGARAGARGGVVTSLLFGLALAGASLVRAALLSFALVALAWYLWRCRTLRFGWMYALLAFLGFANGQGVWAVRNYQEFQQPVPVVTTAWYHLWVGNQPTADGGPLTGALAAEEILGPDRVEELKRVSSQPERYASLAAEVRQEVEMHPAQTAVRRFQAALAFLVGKASVTQKDFALRGPEEQWLGVAVAVFLTGLLFLALLGWRWSYAWRGTSMPLQLALVWIPLPYILTHAEMLHGPRLPLDGPLCCLTALALVCFVPGVNQPLLAGPTTPAEDR